MTVNTLGSHEQYRSSRTDPSRTVADWLWPFLPGGLAVFSLSAVFWYHAHRDTIEVRAPLQHLYAGIYHFFGLTPSVMFFVLVVIWSAIWLVTGTIERPLARLGRLVAMLVMLGIFLNIGDGGVTPAPNKGSLGAWLAGNLVGTLTYVPSLILVGAITFASLLLATDFCFHDAFERLRQRPARAAPDAGVEVAVTDHLRGLSTAVSPPARATAQVDTPIATASAAVAPLDLEPEPVAEPAPVPVPQPEPVGRRRSYFERRAEREGRADAAIDVPAAAPIEQPVEPRGEQPVEQPVEPVAAAGSDLAIDDALTLDPPLDAAEDTAVERAPASESAAAPADVYETPEAIEAEDAFDDLTSDAEGADDADDVAAAGSGEPWVPIPRPEPAPETAAPLAEERIVETPDEPEPSEPVAFEPVPEPVPEPFAEAAEVAAEAAPEPALRAEAEAEPEPRIKQKRLFGGGLDDGLVQDAIDVVTSSRRASAAFLQRKLRIDYALAVDVLAELAARGVVALEGDSTQARVLG